MSKSESSRSLISRTVPSIPSRSTAARATSSPVRDPRAAAEGGRPRVLDRLEAAGAVDVALGRELARRRRRAEEAQERPQLAAGRGRRQRDVGDVGEVDDPDRLVGLDDRAQHVRDPAVAGHRRCWSRSRARRCRSPRPGRSSSGAPACRARRRRRRRGSRAARPRAAAHEPRARRRAPERGASASGMPGRSRLPGARVRRQETPPFGGAHGLRERRPPRRRPAPRATTPAARRRARGRPRRRAGARGRASRARPAARRTSPLPRDPRRARAPARAAAPRPPRVLRPRRAAPAGRARRPPTSAGGREHERHRDAEQTADEPARRDAERRLREVGEIRAPARASSSVGRRTAGSRP